MGGVSDGLPQASGAAVRSSLTPPSRASASGTQVAGDSSAPESWGNPDTLQQHVNDHASDFGIDPSDADAQEKYAQKANDFFQRSFDEGLPTKIDQYGVLRTYDPDSNTFGSYNSDGTTRTFFNPSSGQTYFNDQAGTLYIGGKPVDSVLPGVPATVESNPLIEEPIVIEEPAIIP